MNFENLANNIQSIQDALQAQAAHSINMAITTRNWLTGCYIYEYEQNGEDRAAYGEYLLQRLEARLKMKGMTARNMRKYRRLYCVYPQLKNPVNNYLTTHLEIRSSLPTEFKDTSTEQTKSDGFPSLPAEKIFQRIPCTQLLSIAAINEPLKRVFFEVETIRGCWSARELDRQISSINKEAQPLTPADIINCPITLEFLGLNDKVVAYEDDLETAILDNIQNFLLEMGEGFCFEGRQKRILIDEDYFWIDLVFYHRILKCHVIVELKTDRFKHEYASQLNLYINYYKHEVMQPDDNPPIGLLLCTDHGDTIVKYATAGMDENLFVRKYMIRLPSEKEIKEYLLKNL